jgi:tetratricopeptide (TPR) repeat protein
MALAPAQPAWASGGMHVVAIEKGGTPVGQTRARILLPNSKKAQSTPIQVQQTFLKAGTEIAAPDDTSILLRSSNGNELTVWPGTRLKVIGVSPKGESFEVFGKVAAFVRKKLSFFSLGSRKKKAAASSTRYTVEVGPGDTLDVQVQEGVVEVERPVTMQVGSKKLKGYKTTETVKAGQPLPPEDVLRYATFDQALAFLQGQLERCMQQGDEWGVAAAYYNLANLAYDSVETPQGAHAAAQMFREGIEKIALVQADPQWAVLYLEGYGDAMFDAGDYSEAHDGHLIALRALQSDWDPSLESYMAADLKVSLGHDLLKLGKLEPAAAAFEDALDVFETDFDEEDETVLAIGSIYFSLGVVYHRMGDWADAVSALVTAQKIFHAMLPGSGIAREIQEHLDAVENQVIGEEDEDDYVDFEEEFY